MRFFPRTVTGRWAAVLMAVWPVCTFLGFQLAERFYAGVEAGNGLIDDLQVRPLLALTMLFGILCGVLSFGLSVVGITKKGERSLLSWAVAALGVFLVFLLFGELFFPNH